jgi:hypothetical protein
MSGFAAVGPPGERPQPEIPVKPLGHRLGLVGGPTGRVKRARLAVGIHVLELADAAVTNQLAGQAEFAAVFRALLRAGLIDAAVTLAGVGQVASLPHGDGDGLLAINILARLRGHRR